MKGPLDACFNLSATLCLDLVIVLLLRNESSSMSQEVVEPSYFWRGLWGCQKLVGLGFAMRFSWRRVPRRVS